MGIKVLGVCGTPVKRKVAKGPTNTEVLLNAVLAKRSVRCALGYNAFSSSISFVLKKFRNASLPREFLSLAISRGVLHSCHDSS